MSGTQPLRGSRFVLLAVLVWAAVALGGCGSTDGAVKSREAESSVGAQPTAPPTSINTAQDVTTAEPGSCDGTIGAVAVDEVRVPESATCRLVGTRVDSNVSVGRRGRLLADQLYVDGDVEAEGSRMVRVTGSTIGGNLQLQRGGSATVLGSEVQGDLQWEEQGGPLTAERNVVRGNVQADGNQGLVSIIDNRIHGDLECEENTRVTSGRNAVSGSREGQCRG